MLRDSTVMTLRTDIAEIDLLAEIAGLGSFEEVKRHSISVEAFQRHVSTLDLPGLIQSKRAAGRAKDLAALPELESLTRGTSLVAPARSPARKPPAIGGDSSVRIP
jgi:hypothetical protein